MNEIWRCYGGPLGRPMAVVQVDDEGMGVDQLAVPVQMAMRVRPFPAFVIMAVVIDRISQGLVKDPMARNGAGEGEDAR